MAQWNAIGPFEFLDLRGGIDLFKQRLEILTRPGVNGAGFKLLGVQGQPFNCLSRVDCEDLEGADLAFYNYCSIVGNGQMYFVAQYGVDSSVFGVEFAVLDVRLVRKRAMLNFMGGLFPPSLAFLEAEWTLFPNPIV